jgi:hypothetical protein
LEEIKGDLLEVDFWPGCALCDSTSALPVNRCFYHFTIFIPWLVKTLGLSPKHLHLVN